MPFIWIEFRIVPKYVEEKIQKVIHQSRNL